MTQRRDQLPEGTHVDCYIIKNLVGAGGFSLIYLAEDEDSGDEVVIKEYFPKRLAVRDERGHVVTARDIRSSHFNQGRKLFYQEAKVLASLRHPHIVQVLNFFLANNTAYLIMVYERGKNLGEYVKKRRGGLSTNFLMTVFPPVLDALALIHSKNLLHLDIKPSNLHIRAGGHPVLLDFGAVHQFATTRQDQPAQVVTAGYSPVEQYYSGGYVGPWSDVYAIGASMRTCIEGKPPPPAIERHAQDTLKPAVDAFKRRYPQSLLECIDWSMEVDPLLRPQNAGELLAAIESGKGRPEVDLSVRKGGRFSDSQKES
jgi:serine/threonine protein kinase